MRKFFLCLCLALNPLTILPAAAQGDGAPLPMGKKLIEYGWDVPFADYVRANIRQMEERPFDGLIFKLHGGGKVLMPNKWEPAQFTQDFDDCQNIAWDRFTDNFIIMWAATEQDWFNDEHWDAITNNARLMAKAARLARCAGLCFDAEPYGTNPWVYNESPRKDTKSFAEYEAKVRQRGAEFLQAIEAEFPHPEILTFFLTTYVRNGAQLMSPEERAKTLGGQHYGLLPAFLSGMLDAASPGTRIHDGNETAYYYTNQDQYFVKRHYIEQLGRYAVDPTLWDDYAGHVAVGQALYIDQYFGLRDRKVLGHYLSPEERPQWFEHNVYWALYTTDKYVWCYSERMNWWPDQNVPPGCEDAIRSARRKLVAGEPLGFDIQPFIAEGKRRENEDASAK